MRLICPNCDAEYEVDDAAIPDTGRDVQCSNCGHAWFQLPPEIELALEQEEELFGQPSASDPLPAEMADTPEPQPEPQRRAVDENLLAILREEAEREAAARRAESPAVETQPDLGLAPPPPSAPPAGGLAAAARRIAQLKGQDPDRVGKPAARRDLLPDIEEINSSLKSSDHFPDLADPATPSPAAPSRGFRSGFAFSLVAAVFATAVYTAAPRISAHLPAAKAPLQTYVAGVDQARLWLDGVMKAATQAVRDLAQDGGTPSES